MAKNELADKVTAPLTAKPEPRCLAIAQKGVRSISDFTALMSAIMSDVVEGNITPMVSNATCNAGGKMLKAVEIQQKYGVEKGGNKTLQLTE